MMLSKHRFLSTEAVLPVLAGISSHSHNAPSFTSLSFLEPFQVAFQEALTMEECLKVQDLFQDQQAMPRW